MRRTNYHSLSLSIYIGYFRRSCRIYIVSQEDKYMGWRMNVEISNLTRTYLLP